MKSQVGFLEVPGEKPLGAEKRTNKRIPHVTQELGIEPGPHWWEALRFPFSHAKFCARVFKSTSIRLSKQIARGCTLIMFRVAFSQFTLLLMSSTKNTSLEKMRSVSYRVT